MIVIKYRWRRYQAVAGCMALTGSPSSPDEAMRQTWDLYGSQPVLIRPTPQAPAKPAWKPPWAGVPLLCQEPSWALGDS
jgi:hypothetical protein